MKPYDGQYDTEYKKLDGKPNKPDDKKRRCCHVLEGEKKHMLHASATRLLTHSIDLSKQVFDGNLPDTSRPF